MVQAMPKHDSSHTTVSAGVTPNIIQHTGFVRRIPNRATGADTGDTHLSSAQAHSPPTSRLPPRVLGDLCRNHFLFLFRTRTVVFCSILCFSEVLNPSIYKRRTTPVCLKQKCAFMQINACMFYCCIYNEKPSVSNAGSYKEEFTTPYKMH